MAEIVSVLALAHAPGATGWLDKAPKHEQDGINQGYAELRRRLEATRPDVIVGVANDHLLNFHPGHVPDWCVGTAAQWQGPAAWFRDWINVPDYQVAGEPELARHIVRASGRKGFNLDYRDDLLFDDNWSVPLHYLTPAHDIPLVPIHMNCVLPPMPPVQRCFEFGQVLAQVVQAWPQHLRVAIMATGGLSHDPGGPKYFGVDEAFDRWFLGLLGEGDPQQVLRECTLDKMMAAGDGGTTELLAWIVALGAVGRRKADTAFYVPSVPLRCGMGGVTWNMADAA
jgi:protocatechuate 4,5-dioxygenase beta chain